MPFYLSHPLLHHHIVVIFSPSRDHATGECYINYGKTIMFRAAPNNASNYGMTVYVQGGPTRCTRTGVHDKGVLHKQNMGIGKTSLVHVFEAQNLSQAQMFSNIYWRSARNLMMIARMREDRSTTFNNCFNIIKNLQNHAH
eukprot:14464613-Heterocapsa_arctica.AAC.1